jgi:hypothetical protein
LIAGVVCALIANPRGSGIRQEFRSLFQCDSQDINRMISSVLLLLAAMLFSIIKPVELDSDAAFNCNHSSLAVTASFSQF